MSHIPLNLACERLGVDSCTIINSKKYNSFYKRSDQGTKNASFDLEAYLKYDDIKHELTEKIKLFTEYLYHIEGMTYATIARISKTQQNSIGKLDYGYKSALKILVRFNEFYPFHLRRFHEYYGFSTKGLKYVNS